MCIKVRSLGVALSVSSCMAERSACVSAKWCFSESSCVETVLDPNSEPRPRNAERFLVINVKSQACCCKGNMVTPSSSQIFLWEACGGMEFKVHTY